MFKLEYLQNMWQTSRDEKQYSISLQAELKALQKQEEKQRNELDSFSAAREKWTSSFFSVMRPCLKLQNLPKYNDRVKLDKDLLILQRALQNKVPSWRAEDGDWQLPMIIEQYRHSKVAAYLPIMSQNSYWTSYIHSVYITYVVYLL